MRQCFVEEKVPFAALLISFVMALAAGASSGVALLSKFRGCLVGALLGDCLGSPFEFEEEDDDPSPIVLRKFFEKLEGPPFKCRSLSSNPCHN